jgi:hypothetical protein
LAHLVHVAATLIGGGRDDGHVPVIELADLSTAGDERKKITRRNSADDGRATQHDVAIHDVSFVPDGSLVAPLIDPS